MTNLARTLASYSYIIGDIVQNVFSKNVPYTNHCGATIRKGGQNHCGASSTKPKSQRTNHCGASTGGRYRSHC